MTQGPYGSPEPPWGTPGGGQPGPADGDWSSTGQAWATSGPAPGPWTGPSGYGAPPPIGYSAQGPYPPPGHPGPVGYPGWGPMGPAGPRRPGGATAAGVLSIVHGSWVLFMGILLLTGVSWVAGMTDSFGNPGFDGAAEFLVVAVVTIVVGALCLAGGIQLLGGRRTLLLWGNGLSLAISLYWLIRSQFAPEFLSMPLVHSVLPIIALALAASRDATVWCQDHAAGAKSARL